jgi:hypothetical protein
MIIRKSIRKRICTTTTLLLIIAGVNVVSQTPATATNVSCVLNTDYTQTTNGDTVTVTFINSSRSCDWTIPSNLIRAEIAIVGGGGSGGGNQQPGGGGGGQILYNASLNVTDSVVAVTIGAGGLPVSALNSMGNNGGNTTFGNFTAMGGGGGGSSNSFNSGHWNGRSGGSSGGSNRNGRSPQAVTQNSYTGWTSYGNTGGLGSGLDANSNGGTATDGGTTRTSSTGGGGGGGGAFSRGETSTSTISGTSATVVGGNGGSAIFLIDRCLAGGGGGGARISTFYTSGSATPGNAANCFNSAGTQVTGMPTGGALGGAGAANTGSGGGGNSAGVIPANGAGGSGVVVVRYSTLLPTQTITFDAITNKTFNANRFRAPATTDAIGETVTVTSSNTSICTYAGETVTLVSTGTCTLTASQSGSNRVQAATSVVRSFQIARGTPTLGAFTSVTKTYGDTAFTVDTVTANVQGAFAITSLNTSVISISTRTATITGSGTASIRLLFTPTDTTRWETGTVLGTINVNKKSLRVTAPTISTEFGSQRSSFSASMVPSYSGFVGSETQSVLNTAPTCVETESYTTTTSPVTSPYSINCSGGVDDNYSFTYSAGSLTVTLNDMSEFTDAQLITADRTSVVYGDVVTFTQAAVGQFSGRFTGACTQLSNWTARATAASGTCTATYTQSNLNYESRTVVMNISTVKRQLTISGLTMADKRYDGTTSAGSITRGTLGNLYGTETIMLSASASNYSSADAGSGKVSTLTYSISNGTGLASNYLAPASETITASILKAPAVFNAWGTVTISVSSAGEAITAPTVSSPLTGGAFTYSIGNTAVARLSGNSIVPVAAGSTTLSATYVPTDITNYETGTVSATLTISKGARTLAFGTTAYTKTYGDASFSVSAVPSAGASDGAITYSASGGACSVNSSTGVVSIVRAGSCSISATIATGLNYDQVSTTTPATIEVSRKSLTVSGTSVSSKQYSGNNSPGTLTRGTISGLISGESLTVSASNSNLPSVNAGTYSVNVSYALGNGTGGIASNYLLPDESVTATVTKKPLRITASNASVSFGASAPTINPIYDGFIGTEDAAVLDTAPTCTSNYTNTTPSGTAVTTTCSGAVDGNYSFAYVTGIVTVNTNSRTISISISDVTLQYGETATLTSTISAGALDGIVSYLTSQPSLCSISGNTVLALNSVGTCQIAASIGQGINHSAVTSSYTAITLAKRDLSVINSVVSNKVYDGNDSATVRSATLVGVISGDTVQLSPTARFTNKNVGNAKSVTSTMRISGRDVGFYQLIQPSLSNANITARPITITGLAVVNRNFDSSTAASITGTPVLIGLVTGDSLTATGYNTGTFASMGPGADIAVTTSIALAGSDSSNYQLTQPSLSGEITLILANEITLQPVTAKKYGDAPFLVTATASSGLPVQLFARGSACSALGFEITIVGVGACELTVEQAGNATYEPAETVIDSFTVLAAQITLTVDNKAVVVGSAAPANSYTLTGTLATGETISSVSYRYSSSSYSASATAPTATGVYTISISNITLSSGKLSNYQITYVNGSYSIGSTSDKNLTEMIVFVPGNPTADYLYGAFSPTKYTYSVLLPPSATTLRVTIGRSAISTFKSQVRINDSGYRTLKYSSSVGGTADSGDLPVSAASNSILILITAPDKSTLTYTINVFKEVVTRDTTTVTSSNVESIVIERNNEVPTVASNVITGITFTPSLTLSPSFSLSTYSYSASVPSTQSSISVTAGFQGAKFNIKVRVNNGGFRAVDSGGKSQPMSLVKGSNQLYIRVESGDGSVVVYTFAITRL